MKKITPFIIIYFFSSHLFAAGGAHYTYTAQNNKNTVVLANASLQAYQAFDKANPEQCQPSRIDLKQLAGYEFVTCWKAPNFIKRRTPKSEIFGVVFRTRSAPYRYIFSFRGTNSKANIINDIRTRKVHFTAFGKKIPIKRRVLVHKGIFNTYAQKSKHNQMLSMREQLFTLIDQYQTSNKPISQLYLTGHSLGAALSTLFTLDLALVRPKLPVININFASPKVGNRAFVHFYQQQVKTKTLRVVNHFDIVPCTPKVAYTHTPYAYLLGFYQASGSTQKKGTHALKHYIAVLNCANHSEKGVCEKTLKVMSEGKTISLQSEKGNAQMLCKLRAN
ncbi:MAG: lipase family protein [Cocleimonas sp.]|nr:lipase family protein [Cocleimonas sp.]